jgi:hypothetical protein
MGTDHRNKEPTTSFRELGGGTNGEEMMRWQGGGTDRPSHATHGSTATTDKDFSPERETGMSGRSINLGFFTPLSIYFSDEINSCNH